MRGPTEWRPLVVALICTTVSLLSGKAEAYSLPPVISRALGKISHSNINIRETASSVEISTPLPKVLREQHSSTYIFGVRNLGQEADTYTFTASDDCGFVTGVNPSSFSLQPLEAENVTVTLSVPNHAGNVTDVLIVTVLGESGAGATATLKSNVRPNRPPVVVALIENRPYWECRGGLNNGLAMLDGTESYDPDGDKVDYIWTNETGHILARAQQDVVLGLGLGFHTFTLAATDTLGATATQVADPWEVRDMEPPVAGAKLTPVVGGSKDAYQVEWWCYDECDPDPKTDAQINGIGEQVSNGEVVTLKYKRNARQTKWKRHPNGILVIEASVFELVLKCRDLIGNETVKKGVIRFAETCPSHNNSTGPINGMTGH